MISFNQKESSNIPARLVNNMLFPESGNENLWKQALEKNGLYIALGKFEVIKSLQNQEVVLNKNTFKAISSPKADKPAVLDVKQDSSSSKLEMLQENTSINNNLINLNYKNIFQKTGLSQTFFYQSFLNELTGISKNTQTRSILRDIPNNMQWLNKNALVTATNSNLEVWIRDSSLTGEKLSDVLKNIRHSMAELGASLSKVTVNGKVAYFREK